MGTITIIIICIGALILGAALSWVVSEKLLGQKTRAILSEAEREAEVLKQKKLLEVKEKFLQLKGDLEQQVAQRNNKLKQIEGRLKTREQELTQRHNEVEKRNQEIDILKEKLALQSEGIELKKEEYDVKKAEYEEKKAELELLRQSEQKRLEALGGLSADEARERLIESLRAEAKDQAQGYINEIVEEAKMTANKEAKRIVIQSIQRLATETAIENSVTVFHIESDEIKGRIIGREGRNIRALEAATGIEIIVDDTPEAIVLSSFDPVRREVARLALHQLVQDGRIHPARIEEVVSKVRKQIEEEIIETGKRTVIDLGIHGMHPELIRLIGKMKYRSSYGQNLLQHSRETANLCAIMASELGLNPKHAKRAGLLHDIGKVPDDEPELPHALLGMKLCEKYKEKANICNAVGAHHDEVEMESLIAPIVQVCDAISGARPGARREIVEAYIKRLNDLEQLAIQILPFHDGGITKLQNPLSVRLKLDVTKFFKLHSFRPNDYFTDDALMLPIVERGAEQAKPEVDASALASALQTKKEGKKPAPKAAPSAPRRDEPLVVDLHASEILETTAGMSSADIHDYQRDYFHRTMQEHIRERGRKIVFIHGKGDGVLRASIERELRRKYPTCRFQDASFQEYGYGATQVTIG